MFTLRVGRMNDSANFNLGISKQLSSEFRSDPAKCSRHFGIIVLPAEEDQTSICGTNRQRSVRLQSQDSHRAGRRLCRRFRRRAASKMLRNDGPRILSRAMIASVEATTQCVRQPGDRSIARFLFFVAATTFIVSSVRQMMTRIFRSWRANRSWNMEFLR